MCKLRVAAALLVVVVGSAGAAAARSPGDEFAIAIERGDLAKVRELIEAGNPADTWIEYGDHRVTPLMKAISQGQVGIANYLLEVGADVNSATPDFGQTPLTDAITSNSLAEGRLELVERLLEAGAEINVRTKLESTPVHLAVWNRRPAVAARLVRAGADLEAESYGHTPLSMAASKGDVEMAGLLVQLGADVNHRSTENGTGRTALFSAVSSGSPAMVGALLALGADPNARAEDGETPLTSAQRGDQAEIIELLREAGAQEPAE